MAAARPDPEGQPEVADRIARAVRAGRPADRTPTLEQLLAAFGERDDAPEARARVARALGLAGVAATPAVGEAPAGSRVALEARPARGRGSWWWALAAALVVAAGLAAALLLTRTDTEEKARPVVRAAPATVTLPATTVTVPAPAPAPSAAQRRRARRARIAAARRRRARAPVTVRVIPAGATFVCVEDGAGRRLFSGNLIVPRTFRARVVSLNVGLASTQVLANGRPVALGASPTGVRITRRGNAYLPLGSRPCA